MLFINIFQQPHKKVTTKKKMTRPKRKPMASIENQRENIDKERIPNSSLFLKSSCSDEFEDSFDRFFKDQERTQKALAGEEISAESSTPEAADVFYFSSSSEEASPPDIKDDSYGFLKNAEFKEKITKRWARAAEREKRYLGLSTGSRSSRRSTRLSRKTAASKSNHSSNLNDRNDETLRSPRELIAQDARTSADGHAPHNEGSSQFVVPQIIVDKRVSRLLPQQKLAGQRASGNNLSIRNDNISPCSVVTSTPASRKPASTSTPDHLSMNLPPSARSEITFSISWILFCRDITNTYTAINRIENLYRSPRSSS